MGSLPLGDGHRKYFYGKTRREVQQQLNDALYEKRHGTLTQNTAPARMKVSEFLAYWLEEIAKPRVKQSSYTDYARAVDRLLIPELGRYSLTALRSWDIQLAVSSWRKRGTPTSTINFALARLKQALDQAVILELVPRNVAEPIEPLPLTKPKAIEAPGTPGRPSAKVDGAEVARLRDAGWQWPGIASHFQKSEDTVQRAHKRYLKDQGHEA